jgi:hypothetical protein
VERQSVERQIVGESSVEIQRAGTPPTKMAARRRRSGRLNGLLY